MSGRGKETQRAVLSILRETGVALSAYDLLAKLRVTNPTISAPTIYRALAALTERGEVHRLETVNAFAASKHGGIVQGAIVSICDDCGAVEESAAPALMDELSKVAERSGFSTTRRLVELHGRCAACDTDQAKQ
ncbi:MAG: Fur family transcriptional regulator [Pseudomonadota bacterium]